MTAGSLSEQFDIHASVVFQLGESLITDSVQALVELVKNSYDADASFCKVIINTKVVEEDTSFPGALGSITVEDDGVGMTLDDIRRGWLTISNSGKRDFKDKKRTTEKGRTPLGDKGLGRLGTQRLGLNLEMFTKHQASSLEQHVWFSWRDFLGKDRLSEVDVHREELMPGRKQGTKLVISELRELALWKGEAAVTDFQTRLSEMISPYREVRAFVVYATIDGKDIDLLEVSDKLRRAAQLRYTVQFDGEIYRIGGKARLSYIRPDREPDKSIFAELVDVDEGQSFLSFLQSSKKAPLFALQRSGSEGWFVDYSTSRYFEDLDGLSLLPDGKRANPGPFNGEIDFFSLGSGNEQTVFDTAAQFRQVIDKLKGIRVFRDGFGIRVASDWLDLGRQWTKGGSYYGLKPHNTLGYIAISAKNNRDLEETTDREGFKVNAYYNNFYTLLSEFVEFSGQAQAFLRRGWLDFRKARQRAVANIPDDTRPEALSATITSSIGKAAQFRYTLSDVSQRLSASVQRSKDAAESLRSAGTGNGHLEKLRASFVELDGLVKEAEQLGKRLDDYLAELSDVEKKASVLTGEIQLLREQIQQVHEIIALGLTAEALSHEIDNITTQLSQRNQQLIRYLRANSQKDAKVIGFTEFIKTTTAGLRTQLQFLAPSLQYVREKREVIDMEEFANELFKQYTQHFGSTTSIGVSLQYSKGQRFKVEMNKGRLIQVLDNLFLNSEYWLKEDLRLSRIGQGRITLEVAKPFVRVSDNGRGVDPTVESSLFEPFVSAKGKGKGRGLGLYIVQQLLDAEACSIRLLPDRNTYGRLYKFEIDLTGALFDKR